MYPNEVARQTLFAYSNYNFPLLHMKKQKSIVAQRFAANLNAILIRWDMSAQDFSKQHGMRHQTLSTYTSGKVMPKEPFLFLIHLVRLIFLQHKHIALE